MIDAEWFERVTGALRKGRNDQAHYEALDHIQYLWDAIPGSRDAEILNSLMEAVEAYEREHYPIDPPDPVEAERFRKEQEGRITITETKVMDFEQEFREASEAIEEWPEWKKALLRAAREAEAYFDTEEGDDT